jgi:hypothetical protein
MGFLACGSKFNIIEVAIGKSKLLLKILLQNTQTLQLFTINIKQKLFIKVIERPSKKACAERSKVLLKEGVECKSLR